MAAKDVLEIINTAKFAIQTIKENGEKLDERNTRHNERVKQQEKEMIDHLGNIRNDTMTETTEAFLARYSAVNAALVAEKENLDREQTELDDQSIRIRESLDRVISLV